MGVDGDKLEPRLVWILGGPRSGSTWLLNLLKRDPRVVGIDEPAIGAHLVIPVTSISGLRADQVAPENLTVNEMRAESPDYFFSNRYEAVWRPLLRDLVIGRLVAQLEEIAERRSLQDPLVVLKEPNGSQGAEVLMSSLPRSRLVFLLRDGRDVVDSELDASRAGSWGASQLPGYATSDRDRLAFIRDRAHAWLYRTIAVQRAYEGHAPELRMRVRYEDLVERTEAIFASLVEWLSLDLDPEAIRMAVSELSFANVDPAQRGPGRFVRAAHPGLWRENMSSEEQEAIDEIIGAKLRELGYT